MDRLLFGSSFYGDEMFERGLWLYQIMLDRITGDSPDQTLRYGVTDAVRGCIICYCYTSRAAATCCVASCRVVVGYSRDGVTEHDAGYCSIPTATSASCRCSWSR